MNRNHRWIGAALASAAALACAPVFAADAGAVTRYQQERQSCMEGASGQSRHDCLREAGAALNEERAGTLLKGESAPNYDDNRKARCDVFKDNSDHDACIARVEGQGTVSGSVQGGGVLRELKVVEPAPATQPQAMPQDDMQTQPSTQPQEPMQPQEPTQPQDMPQQTSPQQAPIQPSPPAPQE